MSLRIVSLLPSATEILAALEADHLLVGRSHECDFPDSLRHLPVLTAQRTGPAGQASSSVGQASGPSKPASLSSADIDRQVREALGAGESLYTLDTNRLAELRPDVILTQDLCEVCSIDLGTVRTVASRLDPPPRIVSLNPETVEDVFDDVLTVGRAIGFDAEASRLVVTLRNRLFAATEHINPYADPVNVAFLEWIDPLFVGGHWTPQLIERAGGMHPLNPCVAPDDAGAAAGPQQAWARAGKSVSVPAEVLAASKPEAIVICPCGLDLDRTRASARELAMQDWFRNLPATRARRVALVDGNQMFNRPGPRLVDAFEWLVGWLNDLPKLIPSDFPWEPFDPDPLRR